MTQTFLISLEGLSYRELTLNCSTIVVMVRIASITGTTPQSTMIPTTNNELPRTGQVFQ